MKKLLYNTIMFFSIVTVFDSIGLVNVQTATKYFCCSQSGVCNPRPIDRSDICKQSCPGHNRCVAKSVRVAAPVVTATHIPAMATTMATTPVTTAATTMVAAPVTATVPATAQIRVANAQPVVTPIKKKVATKVSKSNASKQIKASNKDNTSPDMSALVIKGR